MTLPQLQTITSYTLLQSTIKITEYVQKAKAYGYETVAITDHNVMHGAVEFYQACQREGVQAVHGLTLDYLYDTDKKTQIILYAKNYLGYQNLMWLSSKIMTEGKPFLLVEHPERLQHLYAVLPSTTGIRALAMKDTANALIQLDVLRELFAADCLFAATSLADVPQKDYPWFQFLEEAHVPLIALQEVAYLTPEDGFAIRTMKHLHDGTVFEETLSQLPEIRGEQYLRSVEEVQQFFQQHELTEAVTNAEQLASSCQFDLPLHQKLLPHYPIPEGQTAGSYLQELCQERLPQRIADVTDVYKERLNYELSVIHNMGYDDYFLIVWDVMDFAHRSNIVTGAGRGSSASSLVAYVLSITDVDPIKYELLFERFLNPERYTMPDIDLDIPDNRRGEVLHYVKEKYGIHHMAQIATFGTMAAKMVLRDVGRVFGVSQSEANRWSQAVPNSLKITLEQAYQQSKKLVELVEASPKNQLLFDTARRLEGLPRHVSTHAAGVVISDRNLLELVPLQEGTDDILLTQFTMNDVETVGLLKMDFLGLRNLSIIDNALQSIQRVYKEELKLNQIPLSDTETLRLFQKGETAGVFQFESAGIRNVLRKLEPNDIEDIAAVNALYRPGPMQNIDTFVRRKKGQEPIRYPDESLKDILSNTYGIIVYQEQIMQLASKMAGFSLGQADILRRAISKKKKDVMDEERRHFIDGAQQQGYSQEKAVEVYDHIEQFANYGFPRSHAFAYSFVGFYMGYLKVHYPGPFYASLLHSVRHNTSKVKEYIGEARKNNVEIVPPNINRSGYSYQLLEKNKILFGLSSLKGIRRDFIKEIIDERQANGRYTSFDNFLIRTHNKWLKVDNLEPLIAIGAFDEVQPNRRQLNNDLEGKIKNAVYSGGSMDLLDLMELREAELPDYSLEERLTQEEKYLGVYLSGHPSENYQKLQLAKRTMIASDAVPDMRGRFLLYIRDIREIRTKKGEQMAFLTGNDTGGELAITIFPQLYRKVRPYLQSNEVYYVAGKVERSNYNQELQLLAEEMELAAVLEESISEKTCYLRIPQSMDDKEVSVKLKQLLQKHKGHIPVVLFYEQSGKKIGLSDENWIDDSNELKNQLSYLLGTENVVFK